MSTSFYNHSNQLLVDARWASLALEVLHRSPRGCHRSGEGDLTHHVLVADPKLPTVGALLSVLSASMLPLGDSEKRKVSTWEENSDQHDKPMIQWVSVWVNMDPKWVNLWRIDPTTKRDLNTQNRYEKIGIYRLQRKFGIKPTRRKYQTMGEPPTQHDHLWSVASVLHRK